MADAHAKHHDYHLVDPSPWPAIGGVAGVRSGDRRHHVVPRNGHLAVAIGAAA